MFLICGLGNFGKEYDGTRHNIGFAFLDIVAKKHKVSFSFKEKYKGEIAQVSIEQDSALLVKPHTYMNLSGRCLQSVADYYKIPLSNVIIVHDDLEVELGKVKVKVGGSSAGHNGLKSIDQALGNDYARVRVGIGRPSSRDVSDYVLGKFKMDEKEIIEILYYKIVDALPFLLHNDIEGFLKKVS